MQRMRRPAGAAPTVSYEGQFLIAMPGLREAPFARSVVYICAHRDDGAMGIVINQRAREVDFSKLLVQLDIVRQEETIRLPPKVEAIRVLRGGPVDTGRGFVLHSSDYDAGDATVRIGDSVSLTATLDVLRAIAAGEGPSRAVLALGCAGWASGQLESEILSNSWLVCPIDPEFIFDDDIAAKYERALGVLGANSATLSAQAGHA